MFADGSENEIGLASYIVVLELGVAAIGVVKSRWSSVQPLAMAATYAGAFEWYARNGTDVHWFVSVIALVSLWMVFAVSSVAQRFGAAPSRHTVQDSRSQTA